MKIHFKEVLIYSRNQDIADTINNNHYNPNYLKDIKLPNNIKATLNINEVTKLCDVILIVVPTQYIRDTMALIQDINKDAIFLICSKRIEISSKKMISQIIIDELKMRLNCFFLDNINNTSLILYYFTLFFRIILISFFAALLKGLFDLVCFRL